MNKKMLQKVISAILTLLLIFGMNTISYASTNDSNEGLYESYQEVLSTADKYNVPLDISYSEYFANYNPSYESYSEYANSYIELFEPVSHNELRSSGSNKYYYNTGTNCPSDASYEKYNLLDVVKKGDVIYEANGGFGITGHIAIVEGIYTRTDGSRFVRLVEAINTGVVRSILDDNRFDDKEVTVLRVSGATDSQKNGAVNFCLSQLGKNYFIDFQKEKDRNQAVGIVLNWYGLDT